jgi:hypothetical protein
VSERLLCLSRLQVWFPVWLCVKRRRTRRPCARRHSRSSTCNVVLEAAKRLSSHEHPKGCFDASYGLEWASFWSLYRSCRISSQITRTDAAFCFTDGRYHYLFELPERTSSVLLVRISLWLYTGWNHVLVNSYSRGWSVQDAWERSLSISSIASL